jgi:CrcB protein
MKQILLIGLGGFLGTIARFGISKLNLYWQFLSIPMGTLVVNVLGCFFIGLFLGLSQKGAFLSTTMQLFLTVGICGGFTTFSTFSNENLQLMQNGQLFTALFYTVLSVILGFGAVYLGTLTTNLF